MDVVEEGHDGPGAPRRDHDTRVVALDRGARHRRGAAVALDRGARRRRGAAVALAGALLLTGTAVGTDDWFPAGPLRMFTNRAAETGRVRVVLLEAIDADGRRLRVGPGDVGLRHAELEGQLPRFEDDAALLAAVAGAWASVHPDRPPLVRIELRERNRAVVDGELTDDVSERTLVSWDGRGTGEGDDR